MLLAMTKEQLRTKFLAIRQSVSQDSRAAASRAIVSHVLRCVPQTSTVAGYMAIRGEIDILPALQALSDRNQTLCLPVTLNNRELVFRQFHPGDALQSGAYNIPIPPADAPVVVPEVLLIPMLAFDAEGHRLGYGAGYYDRAIQKFRQKNKELKVVGVGFSCQQARAIPVGEQDEKLDAIITEAGIVLPIIN